MNPPEGTTTGYEAPPVINEARLLEPAIPPAPPGFPD